LFPAVHDDDNDTIDLTQVPVQLGHVIDLTQETETDDDTIEESHDNDTVEQVTEDDDDDTIEERRYRPLGRRVILTRFARDHYRPFGAPY